jgi:predicted RNA-binding Zn ribbon-like protein
MRIQMPDMAPQRQPVLTVVTLANATRPRRPAGARRPFTVDPFARHASAVALLEPLGLSRPLLAEELDDLESLADETRAITDALVAGKLPPSPSVSTLNRLVSPASAMQTLSIAADGTLTADVWWHTATATAELACRAVTELGRLDPARLRYCAREVCDLLFYDTTRSRTQRWHSESPCGSRERQDRWRRSPGERQGGVLTGSDGLGSRRWRGSQHAPGH